MPASQPILGGFVGGVSQSSRAPTMSVAYQQQAAAISCLECCSWSQQACWLERCKVPKWRLCIFLQLCQKWPILGHDHCKSHACMFLAGFQAGSTLPCGVQKPATGGCMLSTMACRGRVCWEGGSSSPHPLQSGQWEPILGGCNGGTLQCQEQSGSCGTRSLWAESSGYTLLAVLHLPPKGLQTPENCQSKMNITLQHPSYVTHAG